jgi:hypothetical protein
MDGWRLKKKVRVCFSREEKEGVKKSLPWGLALPFIRQGR